MPYRDKEKNRERYIRKHREIGLCDRCSNKVIPGKHLCQQCFDKKAERDKIYYEANKCKILEVDRKYRESHKEAIQKTKKQYYESHKKETINRNREYRKTHLKNGLCYACNQPASQGSILCLLHRSRKVVETRRRLRNNPEIREKHKRDLLEKYYRLKSEHKCPKCGIPLNNDSCTSVYCSNCVASKVRSS